MIVTLLFFLGVCEIFSKLDCAKTSLNIESPCSELTEKYYIDSIKDDTWMVIGGGKITDSEIQQILATRMLEVDRSEINGANGITCYNMTYVAKDLPFKAKEYVKIHEAIHYKGEYNETKTNYLAAQREPLGFVETIVYSLYLGIKSGGWKRPHCYLGGAWNIFKMYFLNIRNSSNV